MQQTKTITNINLQGLMEIIIPTLLYFKVRNYIQRLYHLSTWELKLKIKLKPNKISLKHIETCSLAALPYWNIESWIVFKISFQSVKTFECVAEWAIAFTLKTNYMLSERLQFGELCLCDNNIEWIIIEMIISFAFSTEER